MGRIGTLSQRGSFKLDLEDENDCVRKAGACSEAGKSLLYSGSFMTSRLCS